MPFPPLPFPRLPLPPRRSLPPLLLLISSALLLSGCAAASVAGDIAGSSIETTQELFAAGKADNWQGVPLETAIAAVRESANSLALKEVREVHHPDQLKLIYADDRKQHITITIIRRTVAMTEVHVDVGFFGPEGLGRLFLQALARELPRNTVTENHAGAPKI